jgi:hypothetical protein
VPDPLQMLRIHCTEFRLLDLPLELREMIYGMAFERIDDPPDCDCERCLRSFNPSQVTVAKSYESTWSVDEAIRIRHPTLLHVSRQVRSEAGKVYYRTKQFHMYVDVHMSTNPEREVNTWLQTMVGKFATHLRDLTTHLTYDSDADGLRWAQIRAQYRHGHGLKITGSVDKIDEREDATGLLQNTPLPFPGMLAYVARLEKIRAAYKEQGEIIFDFFSHWDKLRQACASPDDEMMYMTHDMHGRLLRYWAPVEEEPVV